jgi:isoamylase
VMDSLRYWVQEMHVDGFRFDLAPALIRTAQWVDPFSAFLGAIQQDPVLQRAKLIAEPWDLGSGGYQLGKFPAIFSEWNGKYRDSIREFWLRGPSGVGEFARRFTGSADVYRGSGRTPRASINFVTCHDGFTLLDLATYEKKRNEANGEHNRDGESHNRGWNCGVEGPTNDPEVLGLRSRQQRNLLLTLLMSQGVPMLTAGDELGRTQQGNNNAYCHDGPRSIPGLRPVGRWLDGRPLVEGAERDVIWFGTDGVEFGMLDWDRATHRALCVHVASHPEVLSVARGHEQHRCLFLFNADPAQVTFLLPKAVAGPWSLVIDTSEREPLGSARAPGDVVTLPPYSAIVYEAKPGQ